MPRCRIPLLIIISILVLHLGGCSDEFAPIGDIDPDVPFAITDLSISTSNDTTRLAWTATGDDGPNGTAHRYDLRRHPKAIDKDNWDLAVSIAALPRPQPAGSRESFVLAAGNPPPTACFALKAIDDAGNASSLSNLVFVDFAPPAAISDLSTFRVTDYAAQLTWTAPADEGPVDIPIRYEIRWGRDVITEGTWYDISPINGPGHPADAGGIEKFALRGLEPLTRYYVAVRSIDDAGNLSALSNLLEFTTPARPAGWWDGFSDLQIDDSIRAVESVGDTLYVGGRFTEVEGVASTGFVSWDGSSWFGYGEGVQVGQYATQVIDIQTFGSDVYVTGTFRYVDGVAAPNIARWTGTVWQGLGNPLEKGFVSAIGEFQGDLFLGWAYGPTSSAPFDYLTRYDGATFQSMGWVRSSGVFITVLLPYNGGLVIAGDFQNVDGLQTRSVVFWDGKQYTAPEPGLTGGQFGNPLITAACEYQGDLILAGDFSMAGALSVNNIVRWDGSGWHTLAGGLEGENARVNSMVVYRDLLVVTGIFSTADGRTVNNIALWDGSFWEPMGAGLQGEASSFTHGSSLCMHKGDLYVGGNFATVDGRPSPHLARWSLD